MYSICILPWKPCFAGLELLVGHGFHGNRIYKIECTFVDAFFTDLSLSRMWVLSPNPATNGGGCIILS